mgnify:CR=1 FL=1
MCIRDSCSLQSVECIRGTSCPSLGLSDDRGAEIARRETHRLISTQVARENRRMAEPFKKAKEDVAVLTKELEAYDGEKALLRQAKARLLVAENRLNSLKWEDEVLRQKHLEVVQQRDELKEKHRELIAEVKQKASFKHLLLEKKLDAVYPAPVPALNYELSTLLVYLESPNAASKTLALMSQSSDQSKHNWSPELLARNAGYARAFAATAASSPQRDQIHYAKELRNLKGHWTDAQRLEYFRWYRKAEGFKGGNSFAGFLKNFRGEAIANVPEALLPEIAKIQSEPLKEGPDFEIEARLAVGVAPQMKFDKAELKVKAGAGVELAFTNNDPMPCLLYTSPSPRD